MWSHSHARSKSVDIRTACRQAERPLASLAWFLASHLNGLVQGTFAARFTPNTETHRRCLAQILQIECASGGLRGHSEGATEKDAPGDKVFAPLAFT